MGEVCVVCSEDSVFACPSCGKDRYCSNRCQKKHLQNHQCLPYIIHHEERCGRMLIAARDIRQGEVLFTDAPGGVGPDLNPKPCCLSCYKRLVGLYRCSHCAWPLCGTDCQDGLHARECQLFQVHSPKFNLDNLKVKNPGAYNSIMVMRILWLREHDPDTWDKINMLMDHNEAKDSMSKTREDVIDFIRNHCKLTQFSEEEILHVLGVIDTNAYIIGENATKDVDLQGLFPITSILNHSCTSNTMCYTQDDFSFVCRAVTDIDRGEELTTNYLHFHYHFFGLTYRITELTSHWHFQCSCRRCRDVTEFGSYCDAIQCKDCNDGFLSPLNSLHKDSEWVCDTCYTNIPVTEINNLVNHWWNVMDDTPKYDVHLLEELLHQLLNMFHPNHYYPMEVKRKLIDNIGETKGFELEGLSVGWLQKKVDYCRDHLKVQAKVAPGLSEYAAYISMHISEPLYWLAKKKYTGEDQYEAMCEVAEHLLTVLNIWGPYRRNSSEQKKAMEALDLLGKVDEAYLKKHLVTKAEKLLERFLEEPFGRGHLRIKL